MEPKNVAFFEKVGIIPYLPYKFSYVSLINSKNLSLIGWSKYKLGLNIENYIKKN